VGNSRQSREPHDFTPPGHLTSFGGHPPLRGAYEYRGAATLLAGFWTVVDAVLRERGVIP